MQQLIYIKIKYMVKWILAYIPFGSGIAAFIGFNLKKKRNFGKIKFQGQYFQDMIAYCYLQREDGFFVDIGANDGISGSNTYVFEQLG